MKGGSRMKMNTGGALLTRILYTLVTLIFTRRCFKLMIV